MGNSFNSESAAVQSHINVIQSIIERMSQNSSSCKSWCITLVSAILVIVADKGKPQFTLIAFLPIAVFLLLDAYYLALEKAFRFSYSDFVKKIHNSTLQDSDLYSTESIKKFNEFIIGSIFSASVIGFYGPLLILTYITKSVVNG